MADTSNKRSRIEDEKESLRQQRIQMKEEICEFCDCTGLRSWFNTRGPKCGHTLCACCIVTHHAERGCNVFYCKVCEKKENKNNRRVSSTTFYNIDATGRVKSDKTIEIKRPSREVDPVRFFHNELDQNTRHNSMLIATTFRSYNESLKKETYNRITIVLPTTPHIIPPEQEIVKLKELCCLLHPYVMRPPAINPYRCFSHPMDRPRPSAIASPLHMFQSAKQDDESILYECILGLATGSTAALKLEVNNRENGYWTSQLMAIWIAVEMIRRSNSEKPGLFQQVLGEQLVLHQTPNRLIDLLSNVRVSSSRFFVNQEQFKDIDNKILEGWDFKQTAYGLFIVLYDNFGFRIRGASAGYFQTTMIQVKYVTPRQLCEIKAYGSEKLCRRRLKWEDEKEKVTPDIFLPNDTTDNLLSARSLQFIELALAYADKLPTDDEAELIHKDYETSAKAAVPLSAIPAEIELVGDGLEDPGQFSNPDNRLSPAAVLETAVPLDEVEVDLEDNNGYIGQTEDRPTMYEVNNVKIEVPWTKDLACTKTTDDIREYTLHLRTRSQEEIEIPTELLEGNNNDNYSIASDDDEDDIVLPLANGDVICSDDVPVMKEVGVFSVSDGAPAWAQSNSRDKNPNAHKYYRNLNGPFHEFLEEFKKAGERKDEIYAGDLYSWWRKSRKAVEYVLYPSDPGQALPELIESTFALLTSAVRKTVTISGSPTISPVDVLDHILKRAREEPICMTILADMRFTDVMFMVRDSEDANDKGDPDLYRTALRYTAILYSVTNAYKYVRILADNFRDWYCASDLEKAIYENFLFTQKTRNGRPIWTDRSVEWMMKDLRSWAGKHFRPGQEVLLSRLALNLSDMVKARTAGKQGMTEVKGPSATKELGATRVFLSTLLWAKKINLWGPGPIIYSKTGDESKGYNGQAFDSTGEKEINLRHLMGFSIGRENFKNYVQEYYFEHLHQVSRPSKQAPLKKIPALKESVDQQKDVDSSFFKSRSFEQLKERGVYRKDDIFEQAKKENGLLPNPVKTPSRSKSKQELIKVLLLIRQTADERGIDLAAAQTSEDESMMTGVSWKELVEEEIKLSYFTLAESQRDKFKTRMYTIRKGVANVNDDHSGDQVRSPVTMSSMGAETTSGFTFASSVP